MESEEVVEFDEDELLDMWEELFLWWRQRVYL
jgi:hypothetical protein